MRRNIQVSILAVMSIVLTILLGGCGSDNKEGFIFAATKVDEATCAQCHGSAVESKSGRSIYADFTNSTHHAINIGCQDCHGGGSQHWGVGPLPYPSPDVAGQCLGCHRPFLGAPHFSNISASYVSTYNIANHLPICTGCHRPHDPDPAHNPKMGQWASSVHGDTNGINREDPWYSLGATNPANNINNSFDSSCVRCHSTTGYINYVGSNFTEIQAYRSSLSPDKSMETIGCNACHIDYSYRLRQVGQFTGVKANYNDNARTGGVSAGIHFSIQFPDKGNANICITCHAGRNVGATVKLYPATFFNSSTLGSTSPHHAPGAMMVLGATLTGGRGTGFEFYSSQNYKNLPFYQHDIIGTDAAPGTGSNGPCVSCHLGIPDPVTGIPQANHIFEPIDFTTTPYTIVSNTCQVCHGPNATFVTTFTNNRNGFFAARKALTMLIYSTSAGRTGISGARNGVPKPNKTNRVAWANVGPKKADPRNGQFMFGSSFNTVLMNEGNAAHVHNRNYSRTLIRDSIDWVYGPPAAARTTANVVNAICTELGVSATPTTRNGLTWTGNVDAPSALSFLGLPACP